MVSRVPNENGRIVHGSCKQMGQAPLTANISRGNRRAAYNAKRRQEATPTQSAIYTRHLTREHVV